MRTVLVTGLGGAGRTTVAAATALVAAREGRRVLLLTADRGAAPEALLGLPDGTREAAEGLPWAPPTEVAPGLWAARIAAGEHFRAELAALQERGREALDMLGATPLESEELTELPGADAFALLRALRMAHEARLPAPREPEAPAQGGTAAALWDLLVVDLPPVPEALGVLALPERLRRYLRRLLPAERQAARALRPLLAQLAGVPAPTQRLYELAGRWEQELAAVQRVIESAATTVRLVVEPGPLALRSLRAARAGLALHGCRVDAVIANRLLPTGSADPWLAALSGRQQDALKEMSEEWTSGTPVDAPVRELPHLGAAPFDTGPVAALEALGTLARALAEPGGTDAGSASAPSAGREGVDLPAEDPWTVEDRLAEEGVLVWTLPLPGADREGLGLVRRGDELILTVGAFHRVLPLPSALRRCTVSGAGLRDGALRVRFAPDPALWPKR
ncbi:ArsA family ATPase [Streptomyces sp. SAJ15]|uniref:ArsA family ATPase n=1 Tax=Streptomyces sp. SAJ15 TaxID=2011095 RepID=UPI001185804C|nr:ArsA-related P-loop ATPase [Streptomyces sp. SAJ15]TVL90922.1 hypothetical protein CD790_20410 [Streptomyces sp. SAJ15]